MKNLIILPLALLLTACVNLNIQHPTYGEYIYSRCHWMSCSIIELSELQLIERYESDDLSENTRIRFEYVTEGNFIRLKGSKKYYYFYSSTKVLGLFRTNYLVEDVIYNECKGKKECMELKSYRFHRKL
jgi:hypothetical protein